MNRVTVHLVVAHKHSDARVRGFALVPPRHRRWIGRDVRRRMCSNRRRRAHIALQIGVDSEALALLHQVDWGLPVALLGL